MITLWTGRNNLRLGDTTSASLAWYPCFNETVLSWVNSLEHLGVFGGTERVAKTGGQMLTGSIYGHYTGIIF